MLTCLALMAFQSLRLATAPSPSTAPLPHRHALTAGGRAAAAPRNVKMVRNRKRKTSIGMHTEETIKEGIDLIYEGKKIREAAKIIEVPYTTLYRYYMKTLKNERNIKFTPNYENRKIFTSSQEDMLVEYIVKCSQMFYGLTPVEVRQLAYEMAQTNNITVPQKWYKTELAGIDWLYHFRKRHPVLSLRTPEGCSLSRATSFNRHNVGIFFDNLQDVMRRQPNFGNGTRVFNLDETNTMTVRKSGKVLAVRGQKQVSKVTSAEKGTLVTTCYIVNALGQALPPVMIFPRVHFKQHMIAGAPTGTLGLATASGWMNSELFVKTMQHFINHTQSSIENPSLLIMDNFEAHICIEAITLAKENGVTILTVPPHSTGKLQPLDVAIFKSFKVAYNAAIDSWLMRNPGKTFSIYEVAQCIKEAHMKSMTPANICSAFQATGIYPYNRDIFTDIDFAPSEVTDRAINHSSLSVKNAPCSSKDPDVHHAGSNTPSIDDVTDMVIEQSSFSVDIAAYSSKGPGVHHTGSNTPSIEDVDRSIDAIPESSHLQSPSPSLLTQQNELLKNPSPLLEEPITMNDSSAQSQTPPLAQTPLSRNPSPFLEKPISIVSPVRSQMSPITKNLSPVLQGNISSSHMQSKTPPPVKKFITPFDFRGLPKAGTRKSRHAPRRKGKSMIATDTPNKLEIENRNTVKKKKKDAASKKRKVLQESSEEEEEVGKSEKKKKRRTKVLNTKNNKILQSETSEEECGYMSLYSEEEGGYEDEKENELLEVSEPFAPLDSQPKEGDYILVEFEVSHRKVYYVGKVIGEKCGIDVEVSFLRKSSKINKAFLLPNMPDIAMVHMDDIKMILPKPAFSGGTKRQQGVYKFDLDFSRIVLR
ncbi:hypothetical protein evm_003140 [Chilo suppressalis]|nr:hypothetical protein evm_003140 [Chilo suppressalis]